MENHPIPQDITGFQFKLIGNMTVKQFAYLAAGVILGWLCYILPISAFIKFPFAFFFILIGVAFAFLPFEGRPLDVMITHFVKALLSPTQFVYHKVGGQIYFPPTVAVQTAISQPQKPTGLSGDKLKAFLDTLPKRPKNKLDEKEMVFFQSLGAMSFPQPAVQAIPSYVPPHAFDKADENKQQPPEEIPEEKKDLQPTFEPTENEPQVQELELEKEAKFLQEQLEKAKVQEKQTPTGTANYDAAHQKVLELQQILNETTLQKQDLERQVMSLTRTLENQQKQVYKPSVAVAEKTETKNVRSIPKNMGKSVGLPSAPEFPNLITGIVKDPRGNPLPNILVEVKDNDGSPVRAFKTNALGQFASATPLTNGIYTIEFEDQKGENQFDKVEFTANGEVILPIEIISVDKREELRKSLFN